MKYFVLPFRNVLNFSGRSRRKEIFAYIGLLMVMLTGAGISAGRIGSENVHQLILAIILLTTLIPGLSLGVRRLHDSGLSGWWTLLSGVPMGNLVFLWMLFRPGTVGSNKYGTDPRIENV